MNLNQIRRVTLESITQYKNYNHINHVQNSEELEVEINIYSNEYVEKF